MKIADMQVSPIHPERWGNDLDVVNAARVSFHKVAEELKAGDEKLINYLAKHKHFSPFNHSFISVRVKAPVFVARQLVKHKFMPWNEVSRRYVEEEPEFFMPDGWRAKAANVKQGSAEGFVDKIGGVYVNITDAKRLEVSDVVNVSYNMYRAMIMNNVAPEMARMILPQNMMTEWIWSGTLGAFLDMLVLRLDPHTQKESRDVAELIAKHVEQYFPISYKARIVNE